MKAEMEREICSSIVWKGLKTMMMMMRLMMLMLMLMLMLTITMTMMMIKHHMAQLLLAPTLTWPALIRKGNGGGASS